MTDILDLIDNATQSLCACGCGIQLHPDGPSAWFASQDCQRRWGDSHATNPGDVYDRDDAGDGWMYDAMVTGQPAADHGALIDLIASTVNPEAIRGRRGIITAAEDTRVWIGEQEVTNWVVPNSIRVQLRTSIEWSTADDPPVTRQWLNERIQGLQDASMTITGYYDQSPLREAPLTVCYEPWLAAAPWGNAYIVDEVTIATAARRERLRSIHMAYGRRLRSRRRRGCR